MSMNKAKQAELDRVIRLQAEREAERREIARIPHVAEIIYRTTWYGKRKPVGLRMTLMSEASKFQIDIGRDDVRKLLALIDDISQASYLLGYGHGQDEITSSLHDNSPGKPNPKTKEASMACGGKGGRKGGRGGMHK